MATLNFPNTLGQPTDGSFTYTENNVIYSWNGTYWSANNTADLDSRYVNVNGDTMTGDLTVPSLNGGQLAGFRNQIINGDFRIIQRLSGYNATHTVTLNVTNFFADRWAYLSAASGTCRVNTSLTFPNYKMRQGANVSGLRQPIELPATGACGPFVIGSTWTISVWCNTDLTSADFNGPSLIFNTGNAGTTNSVTAAASVDWASTGETINGFTRYYSTQTINASPGADSTCLEFILQKKNDGVNLAFDWAHAQLEPGPVATEFEHRPIGTELALCQRYYQVVAFNRVIFNGNSSSGTTSAYQSAFTEMRTTTQTVTNADGDLHLYHSGGRYEGNVSNNTKSPITGAGISQGRAAITINRLAATTTANFQTVGGPATVTTFYFDSEL
jgi:hypothetical protein